MDDLTTSLRALPDDLSEALYQVRILIEPDLDATEHGRRALEQMRQLASVCPDKLALGEAADRSASAGPSGSGLLLINEQGQRIRYLAVPEGPEAEPFCEAVRLLAGVKRQASGEWCDRLAELTEPARIVVFVTPPCPHCPGAVLAALEAARISTLIELTIIDAEAHPEQARAAGVQSVPRTVIDGSVGITGVVAPETLARHILERGTPAQHRSRLSALVDDGSFEEASRALSAERQLREAFAELWSRSTLSTRLGLMMLAEQTLELAPRCLDDIVDDLLAVLRADEAPLRGDTVDLLAQVAHPSAAAAIARLVDDADPDVAEAAREALESLTSQV